MNIKIENFWKWFTQNHNLLDGTSEQRDGFISDAVGELRALSPNLTLEIEEPRAGVREMAVSADGVAAEFPVVEQVVHLAPNLPGWKIVAFRQPGKIKGIVLNYPGITLDTDKMWIFPIEDETGFNLIVYFPDYSADKRNLFINATYVLLDNAIGEYNVVKGIRMLDFQKLPPPDQRDGVLPFVELPKVFADYRAKHPR